CYVLDEPGIGLHCSDKATLISVLKRLIDKNNTVVVVEHDENFIKAAENIIEMGPEAGKNGGYITASGSLPDILNSKHSVTAQYLLRNKQNYAHQRNCNVQSFGLYKATANNLQECNVDFISGGIIAVTGVSGSGKSSLINHVLLPSALAGKPVHCSGTYGLQQFSKIVHANQQAIGNNALSTPASYSGILDDIRKLYAATDEAVLKDLKNSAFSYHHAQGKCPECNGHGQIRISMDFMSDVFAVCDTCGGSRYRRELENVRLHGLNIGEMLNCTILEAHEVLRNETAVAHKLQTCIDVGIGHLQLGQSAATLSGGEAQRLKLASEMMKASIHNTLFLLDEPGTGLHYFDILKLIDVFNRLANNGNTIIFIEHNPTLIAIANQLIEMGPGSGSDGGRIVRNELIGVYS
ncbi:MAG TPA: excinuclease ABC subunit UvrA, partial [Bacteroidales bacterium]|nr:excinuclease ABC subunit UvrA [Bacteroidales bacterium]